MINGEFITVNHGIWKIAPWHLFLTSGFLIDVPKQMGYAILLCPSKLAFVIIYVWIICHIPLRKERAQCYINKFQAFRSSGLYTHPLFNNNSLPATSWNSINTSPLPQEKQNKGHTLSTPYPQLLRRNTASLILKNKERKNHACAHI